MSNGGFMALLIDLPVLDPALPGNVIFYVLAYAAL